MHDSVGQVIEIGPLSSPDIHIFHAGTIMTGSVLKTTGGRVFSVAAYGGSLETAVKLAYQGVESINFDGMFFRKDIARR